MDCMEQARLMTLDFQRWKAEKSGKRQFTEQQYLDQYKTCGKCCRQSVCGQMKLGYCEDYAPDGVCYGRANRQADYGAVKACCVWDGATASAILISLAKAVKRGEIIGKK